MKHLKEWRMFESYEEKLTANQIKFLNATAQGWRWNPETGKVDVEGSVFASSVYWDGRVFGFGGRIPVEFGEVKKGFEYSNNGLKSLAGAPQRVGGSFWVVGSLLEDLVGGPVVVDGSFACTGNPLKSLTGAPIKVGGDFSCRYTEIKNLIGGPEVVEGGYYCQRNPSLVSLEGAPKTLRGEFRCGTFIVPAGKWGLDSWLELLEGGDEKTKRLILTLLTPEVLNPLIQKDLSGTLAKLRPFWEWAEFRKTREKLIFPQIHQADIELLNGLSNLGL